jgi:carbamoyltransferase
VLILGLSAFYHDSAACVLADGEILGAVQEERFTRRKYDAVLPLNAISYCLKQAGATIADVDRLAFYEIPSEKLARQQWQSARRTNPLPTRPSAEDTELLLRDGLNWSGEIHFIAHHRAHAASAFYVSGFDEAAVLVADAVGEWDTTSFWHGAGAQLTQLGSVAFPHSLGLFYSCLTAYLGYRPNADEYKVMGLASYGQPRYRALLQSLLHVDGDGGFALDTDVLDYLSEPDRYQRNLEQLLPVPARRKEEPIRPEHADLAASAQVVLEDAVTGLLGWLAGRQQSEDLCLAGGVALNCRANAAAFERSPFRRMFVQPAAGDAGTALGAALCAELPSQTPPSDTPTPPDCARPWTRPSVMLHAYLGPGYANAEVAELLTQAGLAFTDYAGDQDALLDLVAARLAEGQTVGWFQGRMEFGPRALGARSILADPRTAEMRDRLNKDIKWREDYRPFAPAVLADRAEEFFAMDRPSPFMIDLFTVRRPEVLGAVTHVDGTARVQTVTEDVAPRYYRLIERFGRLTQVPVLLNTSFNLSDEPIVCTPEDALRTFMRSSLDLLCIEDCLLEGEAIPAALREATLEEHRFVAGVAQSSSAELYSFF